MKLKRFLLVVFFLFLLMPSCTCEASPAQDDIGDIFNDQLNLSGADNLKDSLPKETEKYMKDIGFEDIDIKAISNLSPERIFAEVYKIAKQNSPIIFRSISTVFAVILLSAIVNGLKLSIGNSSLTNVVEIIGVLCICLAIVNPIVSTINSAGDVIKGSSKFLLCYVPVIAGIMIASGGVAVASSFSMLMLSAGEVMGFIASEVLVPFLNIFLALCISAAISSKLNFSGLCDMFSKTVKWVLGFVMTIFTGLLTIQSIVAESMDNIGTKALKFMAGSFVPIIGGAIGDALSSVQGCIKLLKSGVGAFSIIAAAFIFLPVVIECVLWLISINICASVGDIFSLSSISSLLRNTGKVVSMILSIIISSVIVLIISTTIVLIISQG